MKVVENQKKNENITEKISDSGIRVTVTVHIPDNVPEVIRQQKINQIYDILTKSEKSEESF